MTTSPPIPLLSRLYALLLGLIALVLVYGGTDLISLHGSPYYLLAGIALAGCAVMTWRDRREGVAVYAAIIVVTLAWALWEVGFDAWSLMPRLVAWFIVGIGMIIPAFRRRLRWRDTPPSYARFATTRIFVFALAGAVVLGGVLHQLNPAPADPRYQNGTTAFPTAAAAAADSEGGEWPEWGRDKGGNRFSPLTQITPANVDKLEVAWTAPIAISQAALSAGVEGVPLMVGDTLYTCNGMNEIFAVDAETGARRWQAETAGYEGHTCRGVAYYKTPDADGLCAERIIAATGAATMYAFDTRTGKACPDFGEGGVVNLLDGQVKAPRGYYYVTSAPAVVRGKVVVGGWVTDGQYWGEPSGVIRAFDAVTGKLSWAWDMGHPDRTGAPPPGETYTDSTPNSWAPISTDEALGMVFLPMGNATPDYFGGMRRPFDEKYSSAVVALDAETGRPRWSFQITHHDVWDYDAASQPTLIDLPKPDGGTQKAVLQVTKRGEVFVLDRETGEPLRKVEERAVSQRGTVPEDHISPTQPFSVGMPSFRGPDVTEASMWGITPLDQLYCRILFRQARYDGPMTPPGLTPWISAPGTVGGMNWGSASIDRDHHVMIVGSGKIAHYSRLLTRAESDSMGLAPAGDDASLDHTGGPVPQANTPYGAAVSFFLSPLYVPCQAPPYGFLSAVDLVSGKLIWTRTLGSARDMGPLGLSPQLPLPLGTPLIGGSMTTRSGLVFIGASADRTLRAIDEQTGKTLWQSYLPHGGFSTPITYISPKSGRQFVVMATGSLFGLGRPDGAALVAYTLKPSDEAPHEQ